MRVPSKARILLGATLACLVAGSAHAQRDLPRKLATMTPAEVGAKARITDDPLEGYVVISTDSAFRGNRPVDGGLTGQAHLRAIVDRDSVATRFEVRHETLYSGPRRDLYQVNYRSGGALVQSGLALALHGSDDCPQADMIGSCILTKTVAFELTEQQVREIAALYEPRSRTPWAYRIKDRNGQDITGGLAPAEAAGLLEALDKWRDSNPVSDLDA